MAVTPDENNHINLYSMYDPIFPNEPTSNQLFTPIQFEAYHRLGLSISSKFF